MRDGEGGHLREIRVLVLLFVVALFGIVGIAHFFCILGVVLVGSYAGYIIGFSATEASIATN